MVDYTLEPLSRNIMTVKIPFKENRNWEQWFLLTSDRHWDNPYSNQKKQRKHLDQALDRKAGVIDIGDFFCAMQGKYDPRSKKSDIRSEHNVDNYLDALVNTAGEFFIPYARNFIMIGKGNHETSILKRHETDLVGRLCQYMNLKSGSTIQAGGFSGWIKFSFTRGNKVCYTKMMKYHHGYGTGSAPVTKGVIQSQRMAVWLPDADICITGHIHEDWQQIFTRERINKVTGRIHFDEYVHLCVPGYKEEFQDGYEGFHIEKGRPPKPIGARWLRFFWNDDHIDFESTRAR